MCSTEFIPLCNLISSTVIPAMIVAIIFGIAFFKLLENVMGTDNDIE
jgi:hypothetical protein